MNPYLAMFVLFCAGMAWGMIAATCCLKQWLKAQAEAAVRERHEDELLETGARAFAQGQTSALVEAAMKRGEPSKFSRS